MGTKNRSDVATSGRIIQHPTPAEEEDKVRTNNYEMVPKLPTVKITPKSKAAHPLSDSIEDSNNGRSNGNLNFKPVGRDKAMSILNQYNRLVSNEATLTVKNLPPLKFPFRKTQLPPSLPKQEVTPRKVPIFTEGLSSISKQSNPSFIVPKDRVLRANLPNNIVVAHKKGNFSFGVKATKTKHKREADDSSKFKQMHNLGLDSLPIVNLEKYMQTKTKTVNGAKGVKPIAKTKPRRLDPLPSDSSIKTLETSRSYDWTTDRKKAYRWPHENSARSDSKAKVVWVGNTLSSEFAENRTRVLKNIYPQYENKQKLQEDLNRIKYQNRDPSIYGVCSLAPIDVIGQSSKINATDVDYKNYTHNNANDYLYDSESCSSLNTNWKNMINNVMTNRSSSAESDTMTPRGVPNPPPSYVSSGNDEEEIPVPVDVSKTMQRIQEERTSLMMDSASNRIQQNFSVESRELPISSREIPISSRELPTSLSPAIVVVDEDPIENEEEFPKEWKSPRRSKEPFTGNVVELKIDDKHLLVPPKFESERRPPVKTDLLESSSQTQTHSSSDAIKTRQANGFPENHKLNVTTLKLVTSNDRQSPLPPCNTVMADADSVTIFPRNIYNNDKNNGGSYDTFKHLTVNNKTLQFVSPLEIQSNAKRQ